MRLVTALFCLALLGACAAVNPPRNAALDAAPNPDLIDSAGITAGEVYIGLAFSGGGMRASAFAYGMTEELRAAGVLDSVRLVSGVSGGAVTAAQLGLKGPAGLVGFRDRYLIRDAERHMATSPLNPVTLVRGLAGGANSRETFGRHLEETLFRGATFGDLRARSTIRTWIYATDMANATPFLFTPETFDALCSDLMRLPLSEAVAASAAFPLVFAPVVLEAHQGRCDYREPDWLTSARFNPEATEAMRAYARSLESYARPDGPRYVKLLDGGVTDNFGTTGLALERARARSAAAPMTEAEAVRLKRMLFLVADAGVQPDFRWSMSPKGPGVVGLTKSLALSSVGAATRAGYDAMRSEMRRWQEDLVEWRCALPPAEVRRLRGGDRGSWDCADVKLFVGLASFDNLPEAERADLDRVPTRLRLPEAHVDQVIAAGRAATRATPAFNGFLQSLETGPLEARVAAALGAGGRRIAPSPD
ncbi:MAG: patatin-like phospholipase family protein [Pseudorhodobacter sp.]